MNYQETIDYLFSKLPMFSRTGAAAYKNNLDNIITLCKVLDNPQHKFKSIHIAGTNGKGSVSHMLASIFQTAGYKTGLHTSPHLKDYKERFKINGEFIKEEFIVDFVEKTRDTILKIEPSFFEISVALAFDYFATQKVDIAIIETGLGGRLDSTNIIHPILSIITNIGWDHTDLLGDTLEKIATEKAGIIKPNTAIVIGEYVNETKDVFKKKALLEKSEIFFASDNWHLSEIKYHLESLQLTAINNNSKYEISCDLNGSYQEKNIITVLESIGILENLGWNISYENVIEGLQKVKKITGFKGRWDVLQTNPLIIADVAHNVNGIEKVLEQIQQISYSKLHIVTGMVKDKAIEKILDLFPKNAQYYFTQANIPRALDKELLQEKAKHFNLIGSVFSSVNEGIKQAKINASNDDVILICGSIFLIAEINEVLI
jgi:dihydrofolate synthase/folylpolyglutamate synthase